MNKGSKNKGSNADPGDVSMTRTPDSISLSPMQTRITQLDGLRAVAILAVFVDHTLFNHLLWTGVDIFFVLSGFLISSILLDRKSRPVPYFGYFYTRRVFRILPPYIVTLVLAAITYGPGFLHYWPYFAFFGMNVFWVTHPFLLALPLWSLAVEEQFYFVWPFVIRWVSERTLLCVALAALIVTPLLRGAAAHFGYYGAIYFLTPFRADLLCAGAVLAVCWRTRREQTIAWGRRFGMWATLVGYAIFAGSQRWSVFRLSLNHWQADVFTYSFSLLGASSLLLWALTGRGWLYRLLTLRPMRYLGQVSYMFYLMQDLVLDWVQRWHCPFPVASAFAGTLALSSLSWYLMERPLIAYAARRAPGGPPVPSLAL
jgi:peptidoglycan/LPS O-acetylase OafA/YrhL